MVTMPSEYDSLWSIQGSLPFYTTPNNAVLGGTIGRGNYIQFGVKLNTPVIGSSGILSEVGVEEATAVSGVCSNGSSLLYVKTNVSGSSQSSYSNLLTFMLD